MSGTIYHIYDKVFKKVLTLSSTAVIGLINGLFDTDYPTDSTITYNWTEFENEELKRILADTILTINGKYSYHLEAQMTKDDDIVFRVFEYGYSHADQNRRYAINLATDSLGHITDSNIESGCELIFPEPKIIYFSTSAHVPDEYILSLNFGSQGSFQYKISTFKFLDITPEQLSRKKMIILIPFQLLKLQKIMQKERSAENLNALKTLIQDDIIGGIETNLSLGNITMDDARKLKRLTHKLYQHIYSHYEELEVLNEMTDESLMLDIDLIEKEHEEKIAQLLAKQEKILDENSRILAERDILTAERDSIASERDSIASERDSILIKNQQKDAEIAALKAELEALKKSLLC